MVSLPGCSSARRGRHPTCSTIAFRGTGAFRVTWCRERSGAYGARTITLSWRSIIAKTRTRVNEQIRISPVRLIDPEGEQLGIVPIDAARENARERGLDLVEVAPNARPPVCRIMDYGKFRYEERKRAKESKRKQHTVDVKEVKFRPGTDEHDLDFKLKNARRFLKKGKKVKVTVRYRGREMRRPELGREMLDQITDALDDLATVESRNDKIEGRQLTMMLAPEGQPSEHRS